MKLKFKQFFSVLLMVCLVLTVLIPSAFAADYEYGRTDEKQFYLCTINELSYTTFKKGSPQTPTTIAAATFISTDNIPESFDALYGMFSNPETNIEYTQTKKRYAPDSTDESTAKLAITSTTSLAMMMTNLSGDALNVTASQKIEVNGRNARIGTSNINDTVTLNVPGISVTNGNLLIRNGKWTKRESTPIPGTSQALVVNLSEPITVGEGGALYLEIREGVATNIAGLPSTLDVQDKIIAPSGKSAIEINGGEVHIGAFLVESAEGDSETTNSPLINVTSGKLVIELGAPTVSKPDANGMPVYDGSGQDAPSEKWHSKISSNTNEPAIAVASGATLTLNGGEITATESGTPAIQVENGGTVEIPADSKAVVTAKDNSAQAIDLAGGSTVKKGDIVTVVVSEENDDAGNNYVDNYGNIVLAAGATKGGETLNAAVILSDGTIIEGTEDDAPTVKTDENGKTTVTVPAGGSVTTADGDTKTWEKGGSVESNGDTTTTTPAVSGVTLSPETLNLVYDGDNKTGTLTATLAPEGATGTVSWSSDNENVATVSNGTVTAVGVGTATITATVKDSEGKELASATCSVTVSKQPVSATGITLDKTSVTLYSNTTPNTVTLTATLTPDNSTDTVEWESSNPSVATVDANGKVTAVGNGTATITATAGEKSATCAVTVQPYIPPVVPTVPADTVTTTTTNPDGSTTTTVVNKTTGTVTETTRYPDGSSLVVVTESNGAVTTTETTVEKVVVKTVDEPGRDVTATVTIPASIGTATVTIPADVTPGTVAVYAKTGEVVMLSIPTEDGVRVKLDGSAELVLRDNSARFIDVTRHWAKDAVDFVSAHELFNGTGEAIFSPDAPMTRAMLMTVLARFEGVDTTGGSVWYEKGMNWAMANGISDGTNPGNNITREQMAAMLYRYVGSPAVTGSIDRFPDAGKVSPYAVDAMRWAVSIGLFSGDDAGMLNPQHDATRAEVATILMRFCANVVK